MMTQQQPAAVTATACDDADRDIEVRVRREFREMPGLHLTLRQAARLFDVCPATCEGVMHRLIELGELRVDQAVFVRADSGCKVR